MTRLAPGKADLYDRLRYDVAASGGRVLLLSPIDEWPQVFAVTLDSTAVRVRVYMWHLTYDTARGDYKFQLTGVPGNRFIFESGIRTIVLGYYDRMHLYLAADADRRTGRFGSSPAIQARQEQIDDANRNGFCAFKKSRTRETAVVIRHDLIAAYLTEASAVHTVGALRDGVTQLNELTDAVGKPIPVALKPRSKAASTVLRSVRRSDFSNRILAAYDHRCCVCEIQLELIDAAHIIPVEAELGSDDTRNGLALCKLHHKAYDDALVGILPDYSVAMSAEEITRLTGISKLGGLGAFQSGLRSAIALPYNTSDHPDPECLRVGLEARNWRA